MLLNNVFCRPFSSSYKDNSDSGDGLNPSNSKETNQDGNEDINGRDDLHHSNEAASEDIDRSDQNNNNASANVTYSNEGTGIINSLVLDMCRPLEHKGNVVNFDNYYGSPTVLTQLRLRSVLARCTVRQNRRFLPQLMMWSQREARGMERGATKMLVNDEHKMVAFGWVDGIPVHMVSTADSSDMGFVTRRIGGEQKQVPAPVVVKRYNNAMQSVDRHDQLRGGVSLCSRHGFKKYYVKLMLALIDIALTNANIHYNLRNPEKHAEENGRAMFFEELANSLINKEIDWSSFRPRDSPSSVPQITLHADLSVNDILQNESALSCALGVDQNGIDDSLAIGSGTGAGACKTVSYKTLEAELNITIPRTRRTCHVCAYEGRNRRSSDVYTCRKHAAKLCHRTHSPRNLDTNAPVLHNIITNQPVTDWSWLCPESSWTCWEKYHNFNLPQKLFPDNKPLQVNEDGNAFIYNKVQTSSALYNKKLEALGINKRGRKRKIKHCATVSTAGGTVSAGLTTDAMSGISTASTGQTGNQSVIRSKISPLYLNMENPADECSDAEPCSKKVDTEAGEAFAGEASVPAERNLCPECNLYPSQHNCKVCGALVCGICCSNRGYEGEHVCSKIACMREAPPY
ncbi:MAG: hypothetical protein ACREBR_03870 [bacterium]